MPRLKSPPSLQRVSCDIVGQHWDSICYFARDGREMGELLESNRYLEFPGPFTQFPSRLLEDICQAVSERRSLSRKFLHILCCPQLRTLDLNFGTGEIHYGLIFLRRCSRLERLSLSYQRHADPSQLLSIAEFLPSLRSINLQMSSATDRMLEALGEHCPNLEELDVSFTVISDLGIKWLAGAEGGELRGQRLQSLQVQETKLSCVGALKALTAFPHLRDFDFDRIFQVLERIDPAEVGSLSLRTLNSLERRVSPEAIDAAVALCPAEILTITSPTMDNETLYRCMNFTNLRSLALTNGEGLTLDFEEGVLPLLLFLGPNLDDLILSKFSMIDLVGMGKLCPRLKKLALNAVGEFKTDSDWNSGLFHSLTTIELWLDGRTEFCAAWPILLLLEGARNISNILLKRAVAFDTHLLHQIWASNPMENLTRLTLDECRSVDLELINSLLDHPNDLNLLRIWSCPSLGDQQHRVLQDKIRQNHFDIYFEWYP